MFTQAFCQSICVSFKMENNNNTYKYVWQISIHVLYESLKQKINKTPKQSNRQCTDSWQIKSLWYITHKPYIFMYFYAKLIDRKKWPFPRDHLLWGKGAWSLMTWWRKVFYQIRGQVVTNYGTKRCDRCCLRFSLSLRLSGSIRLVKTNTVWRALVRPMNKTRRIF